MHASQAVTLALGLVGALQAAASPFATEIVSASGSFSSPPYNDPHSVLGPPATWFYDPIAAFMGGATNRRVKLVEAAFNVAPTNTGLFTSNLIVTLEAGSEVIVRFAQPIRDDPAHPYGIDLLVFGNSFFTPNQFVGENTDMSACLLTGGMFSEPTKVSVSPGFTGQPGEVDSEPNTWPWYRYEHGPYADTAFPTHAYQWDRATTNWSDEPMDFTKPVNPAMKAPLQAGGLSAADAIDLYAGSGGGTGFDLRESGFTSIQYVKVEGFVPDFSDGEIDAFAAVRPMILGDTLSIAPENILSNTATLFFQRPGAEDQNMVTLAFEEVGDLAQVTTAPLDDLSGFAPLPGPARTAVQLELAPILGATPVNFTAALSLTTGTNYSGNGNDLLVLQSSSTNWLALPFEYQATIQQVRVTGITNLSAFVVVQFTAPVLHLAANGANYDVSFTPVPTVTHTLERSTNLFHWTALSSFTASNSLPVTLADDNAPADKASYRLRLHQP